MSTATQQLKANLRSPKTRRAARAGRSVVNTVLIEPAQQAAKGRGNIVLLIVGYSLLAVLVYLLIAKPNVIHAIGKLGSLGGKAAELWVKPIDPLTALGAGGPSNPASSTAAAASTSNGEGFSTAAGAVGSPSIEKGRLAPAPAAAAKLRGSLPSAKTLEAVIRLRAANRKLVAAHKLTNAQATAREERLVPRSVYPGFYSAPLFPGIPRLTPLKGAG